MDVSVLKIGFKKYPVGTVSAVIFLLVTGGVMFRNSSRSRIQEELEQNNAQARRIEANIACSAQLEEQLNAMEKANALISSRLVNPQDLAVNLQYFYKLETETGIKLIDARPAASLTPTRPPAMNGGYRPVQYTVSLQGSYLRVLTFLRKLEQGACYCRIATATCSLAHEEVVDKKDRDVAQVVLSLTVEILGKA